MKNTFWLQTPESEDKPTFADGVRYWAAILLCIAAFLLLSACTWQTEVEVAEAVAAQVNDARIDEWVQAAQRGNPNITEHELARVRLSAMYIEKGKQ